MAGENENETEEQEQEKNSDSGPRFTQDDLNRVGSREKKEGREAALKEFAAKLGIESLDEAAKIIKEHKDRQDQEKSEAQLAREAADKEKAEALKEKADANRERHEARVERHLLRAGVPEGEGDTAGVALARVARMLDVEVGADAEAITEAVEELKKDFPALFTPSEKKEEEGSKNQNSDPGNKPKKPPSSTSKDNAMSRLAARHPGVVKQT